MAVKVMTELVANDELKLAALEGLEQAGGKHDT